MPWVAVGSASESWQAPTPAMRTGLPCRLRGPGYVHSPWTVTEFSSAMALKQRLDTIRGQERQAALARFETFRGQRLQIVAIESADLDAAAAGQELGVAVELIEA